MTVVVEMAGSCWIIRGNLMLQKGHESLSVPMGRVSVRWPRPLGLTLPELSVLHLYFAPI